MLRKVTLPIATALAFVLAGCATSGVSDEERKRVSAAQTILMLTKLNDQVFGTRPEGIFQKMTPVYETDWDSNETITESATQSISASGRKVHSLQSDEITLKSADEDETLDDSFKTISKAITEQHPNRRSDVHIIVLPTPLDRYGRPSSGARTGLSILTWGFLGLVSEAQAKFRPAFVVQQMVSGGPVQCVAAYSLYAIDGRTHEILAKVENRIVYTPLPENFWIGDFNSLTMEQKTTLKKSCVGGMAKSITKNIRDLGIGPPSPVG